MDAVRVRRGFSLEVFAAAAFLLATVMVATLILRELRTVRPAAPIGEELQAVPSGVPTHGISVPALLLLDGKEVRVGDDADRVAALLGRDSQRGAEATERGPIGVRVTRTYDHAGTRFILVLEPFEPKGRPRVAGIYIH